MLVSKYNNGALLLIKTKPQVQVCLDLLVVALLISILSEKNTKFRFFAVKNA